MRVATKVVRKLDELGRLVIPKEVRIDLGFGCGEMLVCWTEGEEIYIAKDLNQKGIRRKTDPAGRFTIPRETLKSLGLVVGESYIEHFIEGKAVVVKEYKPGCVFCGSLDIEKIHNKKNVCSYCVGVLRG